MELYGFQQHILTFYILPDICFIQIGENDIPWESLSDFNDRIIAINNREQLSTIDRVHFLPLRVFWNNLTFLGHDEEKKLFSHLKFVLNRICLG